MCKRELGGQHLKNFLLANKKSFIKNFDEPFIKDKFQDNLLFTDIVYYT